MTSIGIDCGTQRTKAVLLRDGVIAGTAMVFTEFDAETAAQAALTQLLEQAGIDRADCPPIGATGAGRELIPGVTVTLNEISAAAKGTAHLHPEARCVLDLGAEACRSIRLKEGGFVEGYEVNDKCASGTGTFIEAMARTLELPIDRFGPRALEHQKDLSIAAQCVVFVESEVISLIHQQEAVEDIAFGVLSGISGRISAMTRRLGQVSNIAAIGGPTLNVGLMTCLEQDLKQPLIIPEQAEYVSALGTALHAAGV